MIRAVEAPRTARLTRRFAWMLLLLLCTAIGGSSLRYIGLDPGVAPPELRENFTSQTPIFVAHAVAAALALLILPLQLSSGLRRAWPVLHRMCGCIYVSAVCVGGLAAIPISLGSWAGPIATTGFLALAVLWLASTGRALAAIRTGDVAGHRRWMSRSASLTCAALTLRLYLPVPELLGVEYLVGYRVIAWICWVPNLLLAEWVIRGEAGASSRARRLAKPHSGPGMSPGPGR